ncbi:3-deoxy-manno-octulosonate cytidylyltransferase [Candidatus Pelagibacter ubique]|nr:3-deoxy-manno-octulosonate cytidylyltransferase [Candidatus Pelagibacter ubique]
MVSNKLKSCVIIPARYKSSRFPGKPLVKLLGKPMIIWVAELSALAVGKSNVYIATDDKRIKAEVNRYNFKVVMTSAKALTGTDRVAEASYKVKADIYINVQGDEPLVKPRDILKILGAKIKNMNAVINGFCWISKKDNPRDINKPKLITNEKNELVYMSRLPIPGFKEKKSKPLKYKKQVCIYAFTKQELKIFRDFGRKSELEKLEDIEILRFLELQKKILMVETSHKSLAVDVPSDVAKVEKALKKINKSIFLQ